MKGKKFFVLSILAVMITMFFTGCSYDITNNFKGSQIVAEEFLTTKGYEPPKGYKIRYVNETEEQFYVKKETIEILFDILEGKPEMRIINVSGISENGRISRSDIKQIEEVSNDFLNTVGYNIPEGYSLKYLGNKKQLQVTSEIKEDNKPKRELTITFNIAEDELEIRDIEWYVDETELFLKIVIVIVVFFWIIFLICCAR